MESETWAMGDGNSVLYTEDYAAYRRVLSVRGVEWFGTYSKAGLDFAWQVVFPTRLKRRLTKLFWPKTHPETGPKTTPV